MTDHKVNSSSELQGIGDTGFDNEEYISVVQTCRLIGKDAASLIAMGYIDDFPRPVTARPSWPTALFWRKSEVENWIKHNNWPPF